MSEAASVSVVTGAPGHLGNNLVRLLLRYRHRVRCMVLRGESLASLEGLDVEIVEADVRDPASLNRVFSGAEVVYHLASIVSLSPKDADLLEEVNVKGTRNVAEACLRDGVRRLVYTSSIHALREPPHGTVIDETAPRDPVGGMMAYSRSKAKATLEVMEMVGRGLDAIVLYPTGIIGPFDFKPSVTGQVVLDYVRGKIPARIAGGYDFVDVRDVAQGHILAADRGARGEGYILSGEWISVDDLMEEMSRAAHVPVPRLRLPQPLLRAVAAASAFLSAGLRTKPLLNTDAIDTLMSNSLVSCAKARRELGYAARPIRQSVRDTVEWFRQSGMLPAGPGVRLSGEAAQTQSSGLSRPA